MLCESQLAEGLLRASDSSVRISSVTKKALADEPTEAPRYRGTFKGGYRDSIGLYRGYMGFRV